jgi:hypothetical protein
MEAGRWVREQHGTRGKRCPNRTELFKYAAADICDKHVLYCEFGVYQGDSMRQWSGLLRNPQSILHGFDSFEGLPEDWNIENGVGYFSTGGKIPQVDDPRVKFFPGWFDQTLPTYTIADHEVLVLNLDADLYSSTKTVLNRFRDHIRPGDYLYFDEFVDRQHELKAFDEFLKETGMRCDIRASTPTLAHVLFQVL